MYTILFCKQAGPIDSTCILTKRLHGTKNETIKFALKLDLFEFVCRILVLCLVLKDVS
jgi:hypothetical protein